MNFFKEIFLKITSWSSFLFRKGKKTSSNAVSKEKEKKFTRQIEVTEEIISEIVKDQIEERKEVIRKIDSTASRVSELSQVQEALIKKKHSIQNNNRKSISVFNQEELAYQLELLETNLQLQKKKVYTPQSVSTKSLINIKKELITNKHAGKAVVKVLQENRIIIKELRDSDKVSIIKKRNDISKYSLIELFKESERKKEIERLELQKKEEKRIQNLKFDKSIKRAKILIGNYDFDSAEKELKYALSINHLRRKVVNDLKDEILRLKIHFEKQKAEFNKVFERASVQMLNKDYQNALKNFNQCKLYDINIEEINEKIKEIRAHIQYEKKQEENFLVEKEIFIVEINNKNFIKANRTLVRIIEGFDSKEIEIKNLQDLFDKSKSKHKKVKKKYKQNVEKAENFYLNNDLINCIRIFKDCLSLDIDNEFCEKRIREIKHKQDLEEKKQKLLQKKAKEEKIRLTELEKYKEEKEGILSFLRSKGITCFYHFTDESNISSIRLNGGLYSWSYCEENGIEISNPGGDYTSRSLDERYSLENFVRLSFVKEHPMKYVASRDGRIRSPKILTIDIETATFKNTLFSNMNATSNGHLEGDDLSFLRNEIKFYVVKQPNQFNLSVEEKPFYQAEIMVEEHIETKYIKNL
ncbi:DarT ssDNA thymidine ADP-ribosyltransferase family protein [Algibacter sp. TI.3.09]|uniref:DarT ssDNA thymidine ADP-ribosyltransferase family protein n=1 Tax=Algibacter sp. TI.3.09 TaxID=3121298 RepID=UPI00311DCAFD